MKFCRICKIELTDDNWFPSLKKRGSSICKVCNNSLMREWRHNNKEKSSEMSKRFQAKHPGITTEWSRKKRIRIRREMVDAYGGKCIRCGIDDIDVLDIDHIDDSGSVHRKNGIHGWRFYMLLKKLGYPKDNYQLLCRNCNWKKEMERRRSRLSNF